MRSLLLRRFLLHRRDGGGGGNDTPRPRRSSSSSVVSPSHHRRQTGVCVIARSLVVASLLSLAYLVAFHHLYVHRLATASSGGHYTWIADKTHHTAAICAVVKSEEAYLVEWIDYHYALGFSHFYLYDNSRTSDLRHFNNDGQEQEQERQFGEQQQQFGNATAAASNATTRTSSSSSSNSSSNIVTVVHHPGRAVQLAAYQECARTYGHRHTWLGFFDVDEFLVLRPPLTNVVDFLELYCWRGAIVINWIMFGTSGRQTYQPQPVSFRFQHRDPTVSSWVKYLARTDDLDLDREMTSPHRAVLKKGKQTVMGRLMSRLLGKGASYYSHDVSFREASGHLNTGRGASENVAAFYHYSTKSSSEYLAKRTRGAGTAVHLEKDLIAKAKQQQQQQQQGLVEVQGSMKDDTVWLRLKQMHPRYGLFERSLVDYRAIEERRRQRQQRRRHSSHSDGTTDETAALCCRLSINNDNDNMYAAAYLDEFVDYHYALGFAHIAIVIAVNDDCYPNPLEQWSREKQAHATSQNSSLSLQVLLSNHTTTTTTTTDPPAMSTSFSWSDCVEAALSSRSSNNNSISFTWLAKLDVDEFLVLRRHDHVVDFLRDQHEPHQQAQQRQQHNTSTSSSASSSFGFRRYSFGTGEQLAYEPKPVTKRFLYREPMLDAVVGGDGIRSADVIRLGPGASTSTNSGVGEGGQTATVLVNPDADAVVHRYATRSVKESLVREFGLRDLSVYVGDGDRSTSSANGSSNSATTPPSLSDEEIERFTRNLPTGTVFDMSAWEAMTKLNPRYADLYDQPSLRDPSFGLHSFLSYFW